MNGVVEQKIAQVREETYKLTFSEKEVILLGSDTHLDWIGIFSKKLENLTGQLHGLSEGLFNEVKDLPVTDLEIMTEKLSELKLANSKLIRRITSKNIHTWMPEVFQRFRVESANFKEVINDLIQFRIVSRNSGDFDDILNKLNLS